MAVFRLYLELYSMFSLRPIILGTDTWMYEGPFPFPNGSIYCYLIKSFIVCLWHVVVNFPISKIKQHLSFRTNIMFLALNDLLRSFVLH